MASRSPAPSGTPTGRSSGSSGWSTRTSAKVGALGQVPKATPLPAEQQLGLPSAQQGESAQSLQRLHPTSFSYFHPAVVVEGPPWTAASVSPGQQGV